MKWSCKDCAFEFDGRPLLMGVLNLTPDSFSDGGAYEDVEAAVARGCAMADEGAVIIDVGGESTRPGAGEVTVQEEIDRTVPVIEALRGETDAEISIDTQKAPVAREALRAGAGIVNDVSALLHDDGMMDVARESGAGVVLMHMRGRPRTMQENPAYGDVVAEVTGFLAARLEACERAGLEREAVVVDPGIGFGKTLEHNLQLLAGLDRLAGLGRPVLVGLSRKSFLGRLTGREVDERLAAGIAAHLFAVREGAHVLRVHDVRETRDALEAWQALNEWTG